MEKNLTILLIEDSSSDATLIEHELRKLNVLVDVHVLEKKDDVFNALQQDLLDLILCDFKLPDFDGSSVLEIRQKLCPEVPFIFVSGQMGEELAVDAMKAGATDYVLKDRLYKLVPAVKRALAEAKKETDRKAVEATLKTTQNMFSHIAQAIADPILLLASDRTVLWANQAASSVAATADSKDAVGKHCYKIMHGLSSLCPGTVHPCPFDRVMETGLPQTAQHRHVSSEGLEVWSEVTCYPVRNEAGETFQVVYVGKDITERIQSQKAIEESEKKYRSLFEEMLSGSALHEILCDENGTPIDSRFLEINAAFEVAPGLTRDQVIGKKLSEVFGTVEEEWIESFGKVALTGDPVHFERYSEVLDRYFDATIFSPEAGKFAITFYDISGRKHTEKALYESEKRYRTMFEITGSATLILDNDMTIRLANKEFENLVPCLKSFASDIGKVKS